MGERARTLAIPDAAERIARLIAEVAGPEASAPAERPARVITGLILLQAALSIAVAGPATDPEYLPLRVAAAEGYFAEEKLTVTLETVRAEPLAAQALGRGRVALAATSLDAALSLGHAGSAPPRLVFGLTAAPPVALLVAAAKKDSIKTLADLAGKTIGISAPGTPGALALSSLLAGEGIGVHRVTIQSFGERALIGALESGAIEAAMVQEPWASRLIDEGKAVALADLRTAAEAARWLGGSTVHAGAVRLCRYQARTGGADPAGARAAPSTRPDPRGHPGRARRPCCPPP